MKVAVLLTALALGLQDAPATIERLRQAWGLQSAAGVLGGSARVVLQLPGESATAPLGSEQAARALSKVFRDATEISLSVDALKLLSSESVYAELTRRYRVRGADGVAEQRIFAAYRLEGGRWRLAELRIGAGRR
jgi:hypothetical protein